MSKRWLRLYEEVLEDPKVQRLSGEDFKAWINLLCLASRHDGSLPSSVDIAFALRIDPRKCAAMLSRLCVAELLDQENDRFKPHGWSGRQYKSDVSTERVRGFRKRRGNVSGNVSETLAETDGGDEDDVSETPRVRPHVGAPAHSDTDTDTEKSSVSNETAAVPLVDPEKVAFDTGIQLLVSQGKTEPQARTLVGKWRKNGHSPGEIIEMFGAAQRLGVVDIPAWAEARWKANGSGHRHWSEEMSVPC